MKFAYQYAFLLGLCCLITQSSLAQNNDELPPNSSYLAENGLSVKLFNTLINPMYQEEARFSGNIHYNYIEGSEKINHTYGVYYDPFYEYGLSFEVIVNDSSVYDDYSKKELTRFLGKNHEKYKKMRDLVAVNEDDVHLVSSTSDETVLGFSFAKHRLPQPYKYLSEWQGRIYLNKGILERIELRLTTEQRHNGVNYQEGMIVAHFARVPSGGYLLKSVEDRREGNRRGVAISYSDELVIEDYPEYTNILLSTSSSDLKAAESANVSTSDTIKVKMERSLPFLGNAARKAGYELPLPFGVDLFTHFQEETLGLEEVGLNGIDLTDGLRPGESYANASTNLVAVKGDVWVLPFLNFTVIGGYITGKTDVSLALTEEMKEILGLESDEIRFSTTVSGPMMGGGIILAGGYKSLFATVNAMFISQYVNEANTNVDALAVTPMIGVRFPKYVNIMAGAQYQIYNSDISGTIPLEGEELEYNVKLKATQWNFLVGLQRDFSNRWNGSILLGGQPRPQTTFSLGYRF